MFVHRDYLPGLKQDLHYGVEELESHDYAGSEAKLRAIGDKLAVLFSMQIRLLWWCIHFTHI